MSNIEHLIENGLINYGKMSSEEWDAKMLQDPNWKPWVAITIDELYEICSYVENTHVVMLNDIIDEYKNLYAELTRELEKMPEVGDTIRINYMKDEPQYTGREGVITHIDDFGQLFGSWGGLAVVPDIDEFEIIKKGYNENV